MKKSIIITYKNGSTINIDIPETYYSDRYSKKSDKKLHKIFMKEYKSFVSALNKEQSVIDVNKYLKFSNATVSAQNILGVDIKIIDDQANALSTAISVPGVHDKTYLDISETSLDTILKKLETTNLLENLDTFVKKVNAMMSKNNVEFTIKAGAKKKAATTTSKKAAKTVTETISEPDRVEEIVEVEEQVTNTIIENAAENEIAPFCNK